MSKKAEKHADLDADARYHYRLGEIKGSLWFLNRFDSAGSLISMKY